MAEENGSRWDMGLYPPGTRIMLLHREDSLYPIADYSRGTVTAVYAVGSVHCVFDNGRSIGLVHNVDSFRRLTEEELREEQARRTKY